MKFAKTIVYVEDAEASLKLFEQAFGFKATYYGNGYGEVETGGDSKISFANYGVGQSHLPEGYVVGASDRVGFELSLVSETVEEDFKRAVAAGAEALKEPEQTPWGQVSSYLRLPDGIIVDLASPAGA